MDGHTHAHMGVLELGHEWPPMRLKETGSKDSELELVSVTTCAKLTNSTNHTKESQTQASLPFHVVSEQNTNGGICV